MTILLGQPGRVDWRAWARANKRSGGAQARRWESNPQQRSAGLFRWIKRRLRITHVQRSREDGVKTHGACAATTYMLIAIVSKELQLESPLYKCPKIASVSASEKTQRSVPYPGDESATENIGGATQGILFNFQLDRCDSLPFASPGRL